MIRKEGKDAFEQRIKDATALSDFLFNTLKNLNLLNKELFIIGYSQGGYLAPFVGLKCPNTSAVIGINCNYKTEFFNQKINFKKFKGVSFGQLY